MLELIRASALQGFPELVCSLGGDPTSLLAAHGIRPEVVGDLEAYIEYRAVAGVVERAAAVLDCPDFGLRLSTHQGLEILGPVALIARHAQTVGEGLALALLDQVFRDEWGRVLASLVGFLGDFDLAEEAAQEAFAIAAERWPRDGVPANPGAWLTVTARNRAIDRIRRERTLGEKTRQLEVPEVGSVDPAARSTPLVFSQADRRSDVHWHRRGRSDRATPCRSSEVSVARVNYPSELETQCVCSAAETSPATMSG